MSAQAQPTTYCKGCRIAWPDGVATIKPCPLHAQAEALLRMLIATTNRLSGTAGYISRQEHGREWVNEARFPIAARCPEGDVVVEGTRETVNGVTTERRRSITSQESNDKLYVQATEEWVREARAVIEAARPHATAKEGAG